MTSLLLSLRWTAARDTGPVKMVSVLLPAAEGMMCATLGVGA